MNLKRVRINFAANALLLVISSVVAVLIVEGVLRAVYAHKHLPESISPELIDIWEPHATRGWSLRPNVITIATQFGANIPYQTNSRGLRDNEYDYAKSGAKRVVVLGDSFMEAQQVRLQDTVAKRLETRWRDQNVEVLNLGVSGYGTIQEFLYLVEEGVRYSPDLVLLAFYAMNDVENNSQALSRLTYGRDSIQFFGRPYVTDTAVLSNQNARYADYDVVASYLEDRARRHTSAESMPLWKASYVYRFGRFALANVRRSTREEGFFMPGNDPNVLFGTMLDTYSDWRGRPPSMYAAWWDDAWAVTRSHIVEMNEVARANGAVFAIFTVPEQVQVDPTALEKVREQWPGLVLNLGKPYETLSAFCVDRGIPVLDLVPGFTDHYENGGGRLYTIERHFNEAGHALAADLVASQVEQAGLLSLN